MNHIYVAHIAGTLGIKDWQVENCAALFEEGCTVPFISRYRKEKTGGLDDEQVAAVDDTEKERILSALEKMLF